jgi:hypothetical protein
MSVAAAPRVAVTRVVAAAAGQPELAVAARVVESTTNAIAKPA